MWIRKCLVGIKWSNGGDPKSVTIWVEKKYKEYFSDILDIAIDVQADTADYMRRFIETVPSSNSPGKIGRVYTGAMRDDVKDSEPTKIGKNLWRITSGWVDEIEKYYLYQEYGAKSSGFLPQELSPMHMLATGMIYMREELTRRLP